MSLAHIYSRAQLGLESPLVQIEVHISAGLPAFHLVGLPDTAVKESKERVRSAIINSHFDFPAGRITINLAPADLPKDGGRFDLAIAIGILAASEQIPPDKLSQIEFVGELSLSGNIKPTQGVVNSAIQALENKRQLLCPQSNQAEAAFISDSHLCAQHLLEVTGHLSNIKPLKHCQAPSSLDSTNTLSGSRAPTTTNFSEVQGQYQAKRALEIAACGGHNILLQGPPGCGKSMLASRFNSILPPLNHDEAIGVLSVASISGQASGKAQHLNINRPFRSPHHSASTAAIVGGGSPPKPGEISLAHKGVLFLDELPEFKRSTLEALREPLETQSVHIARAGHQFEFPASFQLIAAMNPCPCGYHGSDQKECSCTPDAIRRYQQRLSGPLLDRIDIQLQLQATPISQLLENTINEESSEKIQTRVIQAQETAFKRQNCMNAHLSDNALKIACPINHEQQQLIQQASDSLGLSARAVKRCLKLSRTIADLEQSIDIKDQHILEALSYRQQSAIESKLNPISSPNPNDGELGESIVQYQ